LSFIVEPSLEFHGLWISKINLDLRDSPGFAFFPFIYDYDFFFQFHPLMFICFLNFISNYFITLQFGSIFNTTWGQLRPNREENKGRKRNNLNCPTSLTHCGHVHYSSHKFRVLTRVSIVCHHLFIALLKKNLRFNSVTVCYFTFNPGLGWC
jgi:hypothetical protein